MYSKLIKHQLLYISCIASFIFLAIYNPILLLISFIASVFIRVFGLQIGLHRYFCHSSFKTSPLKEKFLVIMSILTGQGSPIAWATLHRHHHIHADKELDVHGIQQGFWHIAFTHPFRSLKWHQSRQMKCVHRNLIKNKFIYFVDRWYHEIWLAIVLITASISPWLTVTLLAATSMSFMASNVLNYFAHSRVFGSYRNFDTDDSSYNNKFFQLLSIGEGLHNNHHKYPSKCSQAVLPGEVDPAAWIVRKFFAIGDVK